MSLLRKFVATNVLLWLGWSTQAQESTSINTHNTPFIDQVITVDGVLDEAHWQQAAHIELGHITRPYEKLPAPVKTDVYFYEDGETVYIAFVAYDPDVAKISAFFRDRDEVWGDDLVGVKFDTFNNQRLAYQFFVNPLGIQIDAIENEMTGDESDSWNAIWDSAGKINEQGYVVEMAIPLRTMNFDESSKEQLWGAEFIRFYPRKDVLRLSHIQYDRDNSCDLCQMGAITGFEGAKQGKNLALVPTAVVGASRSRDPLGDNDWTSTDQQEIGLDINWGITPQMSLQATLNPDFSQVEADVAQVSINNTFSLFFAERRQFFVENADYFSTDQNLVYTRNISAPDFGAKLTGQMGQHTFGVFAANDATAQFVVPGNVGSSTAQFEEDTVNAALRYRYDVNQDLSFGWLTTLRQSDNYHNLVNGADMRYRVTQKDTLRLQYVVSDTEYPEDLYRQFCDDDCTEPEDFSETALRTAQGDSFTGTSWRVDYRHEERNWFSRLSHYAIDEGFRADLGFETVADFSKSVVGGGYQWWNENSWWNRFQIRGDWDITHNDNGELTEKEFEAYVNLRGLYQSYVELGMLQRNRVGRRFDQASLAIDGNTDLFDEKFVSAYFETRPNPNLYFETFVRTGDGIDFEHNRLGEQLLVESMAELNLGRHMQVEVRHTYSNLDVEDARLFTARLSDIRATYQLDQFQFVRLILTYRNVHRNQASYVREVNEIDRNLGSQLLYSYKLNPLTRFFVGVSTGSRDNDDLRGFANTEQSVFMKLSYAWLQ